jgi:hypothetical protein
MGKKNIEKKERKGSKGKEHHRIIEKRTRKEKRIREKGTGSPAGHKHVAIVRKTQIECPWKLQQI